MFDLILYGNLILSHGISELCLQVWNFNISLSDLDSFDLLSLPSQALITWLKSQADLQPMALSVCMYTQISVEIKMDLDYTGLIWWGETLRMGQRDRAHFHAANHAGFILQDRNQEWTAAELWQDQALAIWPDPP